MGARRGPSGRLVVVSNRLPVGAGLERRSRPVGGLVSALGPALDAAEDALWVGWSGRGLPPGVRTRARRRRSGAVTCVAIDLSEDDVAGHYDGLCNGGLWPLLHGFVDRVSCGPDDLVRHRRVVDAFGRVVAGLLAPGDAVWVHDYHLIPLAGALRAQGFGGPVGFFLHVPFPSHEVFATFPWAGELLEGLLAYDLVGFHTASYAEAYADAVERELGRSASRRQRVGAYPIGIDPAPFRAWAEEPASRQAGEVLRAALRTRKLILGADRLDYTKGIPLRLRAFERLLERAPGWRREVSYLQITAPSRTRVAEYARQRREIEELVGHINGQFGEPDWVPVRLLCRAFEQRDLAALFREADVGFVAPLRDGMNLVAKEFVAAQTGDPGVLVLSRFCGAADELKDALVVNPYDVDGTARALDQALAMPVEERARRQAALLEQVLARTSQRWADGFVDDLRAAARGRRRRSRRLRRAG